MILCFRRSLRPVYISRGSKGRRMIGLKLRLSGHSYLGNWEFRRSRRWGLSCPRMSCRRYMLTLHTPGFLGPASNYLDDSLALVVKASLMKKPSMPYLACT